MVDFIIENGCLEAWKLNLHCQILKTVKKSCNLLLRPPQGKKKQKNIKDAQSSVITSLLSEYTKKLKKKFHWKSFFERVCSRNDVITRVFTLRLSKTELANSVRTPVRSVKTLGRDFSVWLFGLWFHFARPGNYYILHLILPTWILDFDFILPDLRLFQKVE